MTCGFFDPLCAEDDARHVIDDFIATTRSASPNERLVFWKVGAAAAEHLSRRGFHIAPYGLENDIVMTAKQLDLRGTSLRGLRRQITAARRNGVYVEALSPSSSRCWSRAGVRHGEVARHAAAAAGGASGHAPHAAPGRTALHKGGRALIHRRHCRGVGGA